MKKILPGRGRLLVKMIGAYDDLPNPLKLTIVEKKRHFDYPYRRGVVEAVGKGVDGVVVGDIVVFRGDAGFTMDGDPEVGEREGYGEEHWRWLKDHEVLAVEEPVAVGLKTPEQAFHEEVFAEVPA